MASNDEEEFSGSDADDGFREDMEALRRACLLTGANPSNIQSSLSPTDNANSRGGNTVTTSSSDSDIDDAEYDLEFVRNIQKRFGGLVDINEPLTLKPLCSLPPVGAEDNVEDDFETLRAIERRFTAYGGDCQKDSTDSVQQNLEQVGVTNIASEKETSNNLFVEGSNSLEGFRNCVDKSSRTSQNFEACNEIVGIQPSGFIEWQKSGADDTSIVPVKSSGFPKSAQAFVDAIKKNRSFQKLIRSKLMHIEARIEEIRKLKDRVKILKDFQVSCRKRTGRALSQKKDARVQLISVPKLKANSRLTEKKSSAFYYGPIENSQVAHYRDALKKFPVFIRRDKWSKQEQENLAKGVKQQFQEMLLQRSLDLVSDSEGFLGDSGNLDSIVESIRDLDITPENMRLFLPKVNWDQLASMYVPGRLGAECQARWLNHEDPLINRGPWDTMEDKNLLHIVQQKGLSNWFDIAVSLGTSRTPFQCLSRYQRSLNASIIKREWTDVEDNQLRAAVEAFGESNWQVVASAMEGRTGTQCSNRWYKTLHPARQKVGRWTSDEDKRLKVAVLLFGPKTWKKIAQFVQGRTQVQCRERWVNCLDPSLNMNQWTDEEDLKLKAAIAEHGYCWSKVAACVPPRTDNQCRRRWKVLLPQEVPLLQAARNIQRAALISNFVDRESERPALGPNDFVPFPEITPASETENANPSGKRRRRSSDLRSKGVLRLTDGSEIENSGDSIMRKKRQKRPSRKTTHTVDSVTITNDEELNASGGISICEDRNDLNQENTISRDILFRNGSTSKKRRRNPYSNNGGGSGAEHHLSSITDPSLQGRTDGEVVSERGRVDEDATSGKRISKLHPRRSKFGKLQVENGGSDRAECHLSSLSDSSLLMITNGDVNELGRDDDDDACQHQKASKLHPRRNRCSVPQEDRVPEISISNLVETVCVDGTINRKKRTEAKSTSKKNEHSNKVDGHLSSLVDDKLFMTADDEIVGDERKKRKRKHKTCPLSTNAYEACDGNAELAEQYQTWSSPVRCPTPHTLGSGNPKDLGVGEHNEFRGSKAREFLDKLPDEEETGMTLASFLQQSGKAKRALTSSVKVDTLHKKGVESAKARVKNSSASCSNRSKRSRNRAKLNNPSPSEETGDDITLAMFCSKLKRQKLNLNGRQ